MSRRVPPVLFLAVFAAHYASPVTTSMDSRWTIPTAVSLIRERNSDLDEYATPEFDSDFRIAKTGNHYHSIYPIGTSALAVPFVAVLEWSGRDVLRDHGRTERFIASLLVALAAVFLYFTIAGSETPAVGLVCALLFAFATSAWSVATRALWQQSPSMLCLSVALWALRRDVRFASIPLAVGFAIRPTNAIPAAVLGLYVLLRHRAQFPRFVLWGLPFLLAFLLHNLAETGSLLTPYYTHTGTTTPAWARPLPASHLPVAFAGTLFAPSRGLFVFSPFLLFAIGGAWIRRRDPLVPFLAAIVVLHWIAISTWKMWWGGHSYGPRMMSDVVPALLLLTAPALSALRRPMQALFLAAVLASLLIHARGALDARVWRWNFDPASVDGDPGRVWSLRDPQILRFR